MDGGLVGSVSFSRINRLCLLCVCVLVFRVMYVLVLIYLDILSWDGERAMPVVTTNILFSGNDARAAISNKLQLKLHDLMWLNVRM